MHEQEGCHPKNPTVLEVTPLNKMELTSAKRHYISESSDCVDQNSWSFCPICEVPR